MTNLLLCDVDGVVADDRHRIHLALEKRWVEYFDPELVMQDGLWRDGRSLVNHYLYHDWQVEYLTGRRNVLEETTRQWMMKPEILLPVRPIHMRDITQTMPLANFKVDFIRDRIATGEYDQIVLVDDDPVVCQLVWDTFGEQYAFHATWNKKEPALIKEAVA